MSVGTANVLYVLATYAAAPTPSPAPGSPAPGGGATVSVLATAIIAAAATVLTAVVTTLITGHQEKHRTRSDYIQKQLNELYAPILLLLGQDNELQLQVKAGMPEGAHLLDRIDEIIADKSRRPIVNQ